MHIKWIVFLSIVLASCEKLSEEISIDDKIITSGLYTRAIVPMTSSVFDWADTTNISLLGLNSPVILPWYNGANTQIPYYMLEDYKLEDGWEMVYNYCIDTPPGEINKSYLIFYNKFTGILRVFYYNSSPVVPASATFWRLEITAPTSMLNAIGPLSFPISERIDHPSVYVSNLTCVPSKSVSVGWNCFDVELAYDDQIKLTNARFNINIYNIDTKKIKLGGEVSLETDGTIATMVSSQYPSWVQKASKVTGDGAKDFLKKSLSKTSLKERITNILSGGVSSLVSDGVKWFLGGFTGKKNNTYSSNLQLTTQGTVSLQGELEALNNPNISTLMHNPLPGAIKRSDDSFLPSYDDPLGVWGLEKAPMLYMYPKEQYCLTNHELSYDWSKNYEVHREVLLYYYPDSLKIKINPAVLNLIDRYETDVQCVYVKKKRNIDEVYEPWLMYDSFGLSEGIKGDNKYVYTDSITMILDYKHWLFVEPGFSNPNIKGFVHCDDTRYVSVSEKQYNALAWGDQNASYIRVYPPNDYDKRGSEYYFKVTITLYPKAPYHLTPIVSMRTFSANFSPEDRNRPKVKWRGRKSGKR